MTSFKKAPLTSIEKEKKAENFLNYIADVTPTQQVTKNIITHKKEATKAILIRMPESFKADIHEITAFTGLSFNAVCLELLRPAIKKKLKELKED